MSRQHEPPGGRPLSAYGRRQASVVIPVRDDPLVVQALASVPPDVEVVVGLSAPPQPFLDRLRRRWHRRARFAVVPRTGMAAALNAGVRAATQPLVVVLDSDCRLLPGAVARFADALESHHFVRGRTEVAENGWWSRRAALGTRQLNETMRRTPRLFGPSIAFDRRRFLAHGGYDEAMSSGSCDHEFALRLEAAGEEVGIVDEATAIHKPLDFWTDTRSHVGYGRGLRFIDRKHGGRYGLGVCLDRLRPRTLVRKLRSRGPVSVFRSLLLGGLMLHGYWRE